MASIGYLQAIMLLLAVQLLCYRASNAEETGTVIPAESKSILGLRPSKYCGITQHNLILIQFRS